MAKKRGKEKEARKQEEVNLRPYSELQEELSAQGIDADKMVMWLLGYLPFDADLSLDKKPEQKKEEEGETPPGWKEFFWSPPVSSGDHHSHYDFLHTTLCSTFTYLSGDNL